MAGEDAHEYFLHLWTAKEAYVKAIETGLSREPAEIEIRFDGVGRSWTSAQECASALVVIDRGREVAMALRAQAGSRRRTPRDPCVRRSAGAGCSMTLGTGARAAW